MGAQREYQVYIQGSTVTWIGYLAFRTVHANGARLFFFFIFLHIGRGLYYQRYFTQPKVWLRGVTILLIRIGTAFLGFILPFVIRAFVIIHLYFLHENGSTNPVGDLSH